MVLRITCSVWVAERAEIAQGRCGSGSSRRWRDYLQTVACREIRSKCLLTCGTDECSVAEEKRVYTSAGSAKILERRDGQEVNGKRAKIDLMTLPRPSFRRVRSGYGAVRSPHGMAEVDEGAEEGFLGLSRDPPRPWGTENREW